MSVGGAERSFLSFARGAFETKTAYDYPDKTTPVARSDAVYQYLKVPHNYPPGAPSPLSPIWHLLSWVVVALEAHLTATSTTGATCEPTWPSGGRPSEPSAEEVRVVAEKIREMQATSSWPEAWSNLCADAVIRALDEYRARKP